MHRFQISPGSIKEGLVILDPKESHHALSVLRVKPGETVELLDGKGGSYQGVIASSQKGRVKVSVSAPRAVRQKSRVPVTLAVSVIKPERMELLIQKACELGADRIIPLISERTVVRLSRERWEAKGVRWQKIAAESCKQCARAQTPEILGVVEFKKFIGQVSGYGTVLIPTLAVPVKSLYHSLNANKDAHSVLVLIGPEGDFSRSEVESAILSGAQPVTLGPLVMRSETAALYTLSVVRFFYGEGPSLASSQ